MSRRSLLSPEDTLIRSQRRGVPNTRMWSEAPTPPQVAWDGYEEEPSVGGGTPPTSQVWWTDSVAVGSARPRDPFPNGSPLVKPGSDLIMTMVSSYLGGVQPPSGWTTLYEVRLGDVVYWVGHAKYDDDPSWQFSYPGMPQINISGWGVGVGYFEGGDGGVWSVAEVSQGYSTGVRFMWGDAPYGSQLFLGRAIYTDWIVAPTPNPWPGGLNNISGKVFPYGGTDIVGENCSFTTIGAYGTGMHASLNVEWRGVGE